MKNGVVYDAVVIGGGPTGSVASGLLAKSGHKVLLLEKEQFPRYAVGESLIPHFWRYTDALEASDAIKKAGFIKKAGGYVLWNNVLRRVSFKDFGFTQPALHIERGEFDQILLKASKDLGTRVREGCKVTHVDIESELPLVTYQVNGKDNYKTVKCKYLIDASGQNTVLAKQTGKVKLDQDIRFQAFWGYFDKSLYLNSDGKAQYFKERFEDPPMTLVCNTDKWGWAWQIVLKNSVSVGIIVPREKMKEFKSKGSTLEERFIHASRNIPLTCQLLKDSKLISKVYTIKDYAYKSEEYVMGNCLLAGDASAFFDPINSEGITMAMYSGNLAAWAVNNMLEKPGRKEFYKKMYTSQLEQKHNLFHLLAFPEELIQKSHYDKIASSIKNQSNIENHLALAQLMITQRGKDFPDILQELGINPEANYREMDLTSLNLEYLNG